MPIIINNTFVGNYGGGLGGGAIAGDEFTFLTVTNCIFWDNDPDPIYGWYGSVTYCSYDDPIFVTGPLGDYYLSQVAAGQPIDSPCVDGGNPFGSMIAGTTRTDCHSDVGLVDLGYHYTLLDTVSADLGSVPDSGVLPFATQFSVTLGNAVAYHRTVAGRINLTLAGGATYQSWRAGYTNLGPNEMYVTAWMQTLPALGTLVGSNVFELHAEDVTPPPYNQPPYPPAGDTDTASCTVTGIAP